MKHVRLSQIDALRGLAALLVILFHFTTRFSSLYGHEEEFFFNVPWGQYGVDFFFIISGFVIFLSLERLNYIVDYIKHRFWRIFPLFWSAVLLEILVQRYFALPEMDKGLSAFELLANFTLVHQFFYIPSINGVYWTLAFEFAFYFWALVVFKMVPKNHREPVIVLWVSLSVLLVSVSEVILQKEIPYSLELAFMLNYSHLFAAGIVLYCSYQDKLTRFRLIMLVFFVAVHILAHGWGAGFIATIATISVYLASMHKLWFLQNKVAIFFGTISYALYLVHQNVGYIVMKKVFEAGYGQIEAMSLAIVLSVLLASVLTFLVERPVIGFFVRLRRLKTANMT